MFEIICFTIFAIVMIYIMYLAGDMSQMMDEIGKRLDERRQ